MGTCKQLQQQFAGVYSQDKWVVNHCSNIILTFLFYSFKHVLSLPSDTLDDFSDSWFCHSHKGCASQASTTLSSSDSRTQDLTSDSTGQKAFSVERDRCYCCSSGFVVRLSKIQRDRVHHSYGLLQCSRCRWVVGRMFTKGICSEEFTLKAFITEWESESCLMSVLECENAILKSLVFDVVMNQTLNLYIIQITTLIVNRVVHR